MGRGYQGGFRRFTKMLPNWGEEGTGGLAVRPLTTECMHDPVRMHRFKSQ